MKHDLERKKTSAAFSVYKPFKEDEGGMDWDNKNIHDYGRQNVHNGGAKSQELNRKNRININQTFNIPKLNSDLKEVKTNGNNTQLQSAKNVNDYNSSQQVAQTEVPIVSKEIQLAQIQLSNVFGSPDKAVTSEEFSS